MRYFLFGGRHCADVPEELQYRRNMKLELMSLRRVSPKTLQALCNLHTIWESANNSIFLRLLLAVYLRLGIRVVIMYPSYKLAARDQMYVSVSDLSLNVLLPLLFFNENFCFHPRSEKSVTKKNWSQSGIGTITFIFL